MSSLSATWTNCGRISPSADSLRQARSGRFCTRRLFRTPDTPVTAREVPGLADVLDRAHEAGQAHHAALRLDLDVHGAQDRVSCEDAFHLRGERGVRRGGFLLRLRRHAGAKQRRQDPGGAAAAHIASLFSASAQPEATSRLGSASALLPGIVAQPFFITYSLCCQLSVALSAARRPFASGDFCVWNCATQIGTS